MEESSVIFCQDELPNRTTTPKVPFDVSASRRILLYRRESRLSHRISNIFEIVFD